MYVDKNTIFSERQSVAANAVSATLDLYPGYRGGERPFIVALASGFTGEGALEIQVETSAQADFSAARRVASFPLSAAELAAGGEVLAVSLPRNVERYLRLNYVVSGEIGALTLNAMLALDI